MHISNVSYITLLISYVSPIIESYVPMFNYVFSRKFFTQKINCPSTTQPANSPCSHPCPTHLHQLPACQPSLANPCPAQLPCMPIQHCYIDIAYNAIYCKRAVQSQFPCEGCVCECVIKRLTEWTVQQSGGPGLEKPQHGPLFFQYIWQFKEKQQPSLLRHIYSAIITAHTPHLEYLS